MKYYYNQKRLKGLTFEEGLKVYLIRKNIKIKRLNDKLDFKKLKLFTIKIRISYLNYEFLVPKIIKIYPVFHILLFKLITDSV